MTSILAMWV